MPNITSTSMLFSATSASSRSVIGPLASYSFRTISVVAGAVSIATTASSSASGQVRPLITSTRHTRTNARVPSQS